MATVLLVGFGHPESAQLVADMKVSAPQHTFGGFPEDMSEPATDDSAVVLIWCPRNADDASTVISDYVERGLPTVALLQDTRLPVFDYSKGHVEVAFAPVQPAETLQRIDLVLARARGPMNRNIITHGDLVIDQDRYEVRLSGRKVDLTYKEYELLKYIAARPGRVFSREALLRAVWDYDYFGGTRTVDVHVRRLRSKINDVRYQFIETVWNVGYRFRSTSEQPSE